MLQTIPGVEEQVAIVKDLSRDNDRDITFTREGIFVSNDLVVISLRLCVFRNAVYSMYCVYMMMVHTCHATFPSSQEGQ